MRLCAVFSVSTRSQLFGALAVRANQRLDEPGTHVLSDTSAAGASPLNGRWLDPTDHVFSLGPRAIPTREPLGEARSQEVSGGPLLGKNGRASPN
jgi:hypothetical protein